ncbi:hypothetical protein GRI34_10450 [Erythrobacter aquimaris]|uniref:Asparagine synthetase domain-containing protein n=1 Tax=Qipengyuania aquimaris TaxID=255984 RepID=A0A6I4TLM9_9SPHN|nr:asparagine synthase-related protein [Qipengyuania aquimaris]MXO96834.1 hypothetical protein [Qipengyuania aquimaris]
MDRQSSGRSRLFGRIDNRTEICDYLGLDPSIEDGVLYDFALDRWGDDTDGRLVGHYCVITVLGPGRLRLVRSPWTAPPLHFVAEGGRIIASPILSVIFAGGHPREVDYNYLRDQLAFDHHDCESSGWYRGISRVPIGCRAHCSPSGFELERYYDPTAISPVRLANDDQYVERAAELIQEAAAVALAGSTKAGIMISGGLDSPIIAAACLNCSGPSATLEGYTAGTVSHWDGRVPSGTFGDERERVRRFACQHPRLKLNFPDPNKGGHDYRLRELLGVTETPTANVANIGIFHGLFEAAAKDGCDRLMNAMLGNFSFSLDGHWAAASHLRNGNWRKLAAVLRRPLATDKRPWLRRFLAQALLPNLPSAWQRHIRSAAHPDRFGFALPASPLSRSAIESWRADRTDQSVFEQPSLDSSQADAIRRMWASADSGEDLDLGLERLHGIQLRDVTAYRPLIEFCQGLPVEQLRRGGVDRYLARRLARGIMPEAQRLEQRQGRHNPDWHARIGSRRKELSERLENISMHPQLGGMIDTEMLKGHLDDWGEHTPTEPAQLWPRYFALTRALTAATFVSRRTTK